MKTVAITRKNRCFFETLIGIAVLLLVNQLWFSHNLGYIGVSPNPYWFVVIFIALRYGDLGGMTAGFLAAIVLLVSSSLNILFTSERLWYQIPYKQWQLAGLFIFLGFFVGQERSRVDKLLNKVYGKYNNLRGEFENLVMDNLSLKKVNTELEGRILGQSDTVNTVYDIAKSLNESRIEKMYSTITKMAKRIIGAEKCTFYLWTEGQYVLKSSSDEKVADEDKILDQDSDIIKLALDVRKVVTVKDVINSDGMKWDEGKDPPLVAPLFFGETKDSAAGLLVINELSFTKLNPNSINLVSIMSNWVSKSLDNTYKATKVSLEDIYDKEIGLFTYSYGLRRLEEEMLQVVVTGNTATLMLVGIDGFGDKASDEQKSVSAKTSSVLKDTLRPGDIVAMTDIPGALMILLPETNTKKAKIVSKRILQQVRTSQSKPSDKKGDDISVNVTTVTIGEGTEYDKAADVINDAKKDLPGVRV